MDPRAWASRRDLLKLGGAAVGVAALPFDPRVAAAQTPKRGGIFRLRGEDPLGFDPHLTLSYKTMGTLSFTHSRLLKVKAGSSVLSTVLAASNAFDQMSLPVTTS